ncbi:hypothetical protein B0H12DRAFT_1171781 [Mycena haematopus]|nr:hypothetical protein B0H12DRAFT_1171781 [Mycena haematopus]
MLPQLTTLNDGYVLPGPASIAFAVTNMGGASEITKRLVPVLKGGVRHLIIPVNFANLSQLSAALASSSIRREDLFITFIYQPAAGTPDPEKALKKALDQLRLQYVDLYLLREAGNKANTTIWMQLEKLKGRGQLVRSIGLLNFNLNNILALLPTLTIIPAVNQILLTPYAAKRLEKTIKACEKLGIAVTASLSDTVFQSLAGRTLSADSTRYRAYRETALLNADTHPRRLAPIPGHFTCNNLERERTIDHRPSDAVSSSSFQIAPIGTCRSIYDTVVIDTHDH